MTFKDVAIKNFKANIRKYSAYFLCSSFSVMVIFMFSTLICNKQLTDFCKMINVSFIIYFSLIAVIVFSIFFINYAHTTFIKSRHKEFALYMTLGMTKKDINKIVLVENSLILAFSMLIGLISGVLFSRLFQMVLMKLIDIDNIEFSFDIRSFLITFVTFTVIYVTVIFLSWVSTRKLEISELLKHSRKNKKQGYSLIAGIIGIILVLLSSVMMFIISDNKDLNNMLTLLIYYIVCFTGVYLILSNFGVLIISLIKGRSRVYYSNLLSVNEISSKFSQNKKIIFVLCILSSIIIFCIASPFALYQQAGNIAVNTSPANIEYACVAGINAISDKDIDNLISKDNIKLTERKSYEFLKADYKGGGDNYDFLHIKPVISVSTFNKFFSKTLEIPEGKAMNYVTAWEPNNHGLNSGDEFELLTPGKAYKYQVQESTREAFIANGSVFPSSSGLVLNDKDYNSLKSAIDPSNIGSFKILMFDDWKNLENIINNLSNKLAKLNSEIKQPSTNISKLFGIYSTLGTYTELKKVYSVMFFIFSFMGLLFFITSGSVLYFKQYSELTETKAKFSKLYKIGIKSREIRTVISRELAVTFFTPLIFGTIVGYSMMYLMTFMLGGAFMLGPFMKFATFAVIAYFLFQSVFYLITKKKYVHEITG